MITAKEAMELSYKYKSIKNIEDSFRYIDMEIRTSAIQGGDHVHIKQGDLCVDLPNVYINSELKKGGYVIDNSKDVDDGWILTIWWEEK